MHSAKPEEIDTLTRSTSRGASPQVSVSGIAINGSHNCERRGCGCAYSILHPITGTRIDRPTFLKKQSKVASSSSTSSVFRIELPARYREMRTLLCDRNMTDECSWNPASDGDGVVTIWIGMTSFQ